MRWAKVAGGVVGGVVLLVLAAVTAIAVAGDPLIKRLTTSYAAGSLGRCLHIDGPFSVDWGWRTSVSAEGIRLCNAEWGTRPEMFTAMRADAVIDLRRILEFEVQVPRITLVQPDLLLERAADGTPNWRFKEDTEGGGIDPRTLEHLSVENGNLTYIDHAQPGQPQEPFEVAIARLTAEPRDDILHVESAGTYDRRPFTAQARLGLSAPRQAEGVPYPVTLDASIGHTRLHVDGAMADPLALEGYDLRLMLDGESMEELYHIAGLPLPPTPKYRLAGHVTGGGQTWRVEEFEGWVGESDLRGAVDIRLDGPRPWIGGELTSKRLDLDDVKGFYGGTPGEEEAGTKPAPSATATAKADTPPRKGGRVLPDTPISLPKLNAVDTQIRYEAQEVRSGNLPFSRIGLTVTLDDGLLRIAPIRFALVGGRVEAGVEIDSNTQPPPVRLDARGENLDLGKLLESLEVTPHASGRFGAEIRLRSVGRTTRELAAKMDGVAALVMVGGEFSNELMELITLDLTEWLAARSSEDKDHPIKCLVARFVVQDGIATADTLVFETTDTVVKGKGSLNFQDETVAITLTPDAKDPSLGSVTSDLHIRGTFSERQAGPDTGQIAGRVGAAAALGALLTPLAALLPFIEPGSNEHNACERALAGDSVRAGKPAPQERSRE